MASETKVKFEEVIINIDLRNVASETNVKFEEVIVKTEIENEIDEPEVKSENKRTNLELQSWRAAVRSLLASSNATVIRNYSDKGYGCCFCSEQFPDPAKLKTHNIDKHKVDIIKFKGDKVQTRFFVKMDITNLKCNLCERKFDTIEQIISHLNESHRMKVLPAIKRLIFPFKFDSNELQCCECLQIFNAFKYLQAHMHSHYRNYICDVCSAGFITKKSLLVHTAALHATESVKCNYCSKVFDSQRKANKHVSKVHKQDKGSATPMCRLCNERFKTYALKQKHRKEVHGVGATPEKVKCLACDKWFSKSHLLSHTERFHMMLKRHKCTECEKEFYSSSELTKHIVKHTSERKYSCETCPKTNFKTAQALRLHIRRHHLMERQHPCSECELKFFTTSELKRHMATHNGLREFKCNICHKAFVRQKTLKQHMPIHLKEKRFKCEHCGQTFVQKVCWKGHMRSKHGEMV